MRPESQEKPILRGHRKSVGFDPTCKCDLGQLDVDQWPSIRKPSSSPCTRALAISGLTGSAFSVRATTAV